MMRLIALVVLVVIVVFAVIFFLARNYSKRDRYIRRDYQKFRQLDAQLEQRTDVLQRSTQKHYPDAMP